MWLRRFLYRFGIGHVTFDGTEAQFWREAVRHIPFTYRWLGRSLSIADVDAELSTVSDWQDLKASVGDGDRICPFEINPHTMAMRRGYVVIRDGEPIGVVVTLVS